MRSEDEKVLGAISLINHLECAHVGEANRFELRDVEIHEEILAFFRVSAVICVPPIRATEEPVKSGFVIAMFTPPHDRIVLKEMRNSLRGWPAVRAMRSKGVPAKPKGSTIIRDGASDLPSSSSLSRISPK
jgi:hypothetical protein